MRNSICSTSGQETQFESSSLFVLKIQFLNLKRSDRSQGHEVKLQRTQPCKNFEINFKAKGIITCNEMIEFNPQTYKLLKIYKFNEDNKLLIYNRIIIESRSNLDYFLL